MAFVVTYALGGPGRGPISAIHKEDLVVVPVSLTFGGSDTYVTGGYAIVLPDEIAELQLVDVLMSKAHDGTRRWEWDGSQSAPKLLAYDAFATEEGNGANIASVVLRAVLLLK